MYSLQMRWRIFAKGFQLYFSRPGAVTRFSAALTVLVLVFTGSVGTYAYTSDDVNVLHPLYPVKQGIESAELGLAHSPEERARIHLKLALKRMDEAEKLEEREEAFEQTLEMMDGDVRQSITSAAVEHDAVIADHLSAHMEERMDGLKQRIKHLKDADGKNYKPGTRDRLERMETFTGHKIERIKEARNHIREALKEPQKRVFLREFLEDEEHQDDAGQEEDGPDDEPQQDQEIQTDS